MSHDLQGRWNKTNGGMSKNEDSKLYRAVSRAAKYTDSIILTEGATVDCRDSKKISFNEIYSHIEESSEGKDIPQRLKMYEGNISPKNGIEYGIVPDGGCIDVFVPYNGSKKHIYLAIPEYKSQGADNNSGTVGNVTREGIGTYAKFFYDMFHFDEVMPLLFFGHGKDFLNESFKANVQTIIGNGYNQVTIYKDQGITFFFKETPWEEDEMFSALKTFVNEMLKYWEGKGFLEVNWD